MSCEQPKSSQGMSSKKGTLENLSREELIKKCIGLLGLAQKAKQSKDELAEENKRIKEDLSKFETQKEADKKSLMAMKEMVDALTENKLSQTSIISDLNIKLKNYEAEKKCLLDENNKITEFSIENESLRRQIKRLEDDNEELLCNLDNMEKKLDQVNAFGVQQHKDLILLEEATAKWDTLEKSLRHKTEKYEEEILYLKDKILKLEGEKLSSDSKDNKINEEFIKKLQIENKNLQNELDEMIENVKNNQNLQDKLIISEELCENQRNNLNELQKIYDLKENEIEKIKTKIIQVNVDLKSLKETKETLIEFLKNYTTFNLKWPNKIQNEINLLCSELNLLEKSKKDMENKLTELEYENKILRDGRFFYEEKLNDLISYCDTVLIENLQLELQSKCCPLENKKDSIDAETNINLMLDISSFDEVQNLKDSLVKITTEYEKCCKHLITMQEDFNKQTILYENSKEELKNVKDALENEKYNQEKLKEDFYKTEEELKLSKEENEVIKKNLNDNKERSEKIQNTLNCAEKSQNDLLDEMRELNEALKGRGDVISRQQDKIADLENEMILIKENITQLENNLIEKNSEINEKDNKINEIEKEIGKIKNESAHLTENLCEKEKIIKNLSEEITFIRERAMDTQSEIMSTSTVSKIEETHRMKEVDESFEEKYNKLRSLAIKLKKKVQEQATQIAILESDNKKNFEEKNEITTKLGTINVQVKNLQALQNENDKLLDEIEKIKKDQENSNKIIKELMEKVDILTASEMTARNSVQEYENQIKFFKMEKDSFNLIRREWEKEREVLKNENIIKEKELITIRNQSEKIKFEMEKCKAAGKQSNVLNLEIEAYEKSLNDTTQNLKLKEALIKDLQESLKSRDEFIQSHKKEIKLLEESLQSERDHSIELKQQIDIQQVKSKENEYEKLQLRDRLQDLTLELENLKSKLDELNLEISEISRERDQINVTFKKDKNDLYKKLTILEENLICLTNKLKTTECELEDLRTEYANYKVRAQNILRQSQTKETSRERELEEEIILMRATIEKLNLQISCLENNLLKSENKEDELRQDNERIQKRCKELLQLLEESRIENETILEDNRKQSLDYQESLKSHRIQIDAINNCYKKQVEELEKKHSVELIELKKVSCSKDAKLVSRIAPYGSSKTSDEQKIDLILMEREDAEGSETSNFTQIPKRKISATRSKHDLIPLDELLNTSFDDNVKDSRSNSPSLDLQIAKEKLQMQESRVKHLTALLSESEQDLAKLTQLNELLKEEVRRHERAVEREKHIQNSEYLKNVVFKFLTLHNGDERTRLVPVLNTILKLSPEETQTLQNVAKGAEAIQRGWGSYLPIWSNHQ